MVNINGGQLIKGFYRKFTGHSQLASNDLKGFYNVLKTEHYNDFALH